MLRTTTNEKERSICKVRAASAQRAAGVPKACKRPQIRHNKVTCVVNGSGRVVGARTGSPPSG